MKKALLFYLENCPYCRSARKALAELTREEPKYAAVELTWVEESREPGLAESYDYYYVPSVFHGSEKLYEARPGESYAECRAQLKAALDAILVS